MRCAWPYLCQSLKNLQENVLGIKDPLVRPLSDVISVALLYRLLPSKNKNQELAFTVGIKSCFSFRYQQCRSPSAGEGTELQRELDGRRH